MISRSVALGALILTFAIAAGFLFNIQNVYPRAPLYHLVKQGIPLTELQPIPEFALRGILPKVYQLDHEGTEMIRVYSFPSLEQRSAALQQYQERQRAMSIHDPIVFQDRERPILVIYHYRYTDASTQPPVLGDTRYGAALSKLYSLSSQ